MVARQSPKLFVIVRIYSFVQKSLFERNGTDKVKVNKDDLAVNGLF